MSTKYEIINKNYFLFAFFLVDASFRQINKAILRRKQKWLDFLIKRSKRVASGGHFEIVGTKLYIIKFHFTY